VVYDRRYDRFQWWDGRERKWKCTFYALRDPRNGEVRYVGRTFNERERKADHIRKTLSGRPRKRAWLHELHRSGLRPVFLVLERGMHVPSTAYARELQLVERLLRLGCDLVNDEALWSRAARRLTINARKQHWVLRG
jgi:hypothetical protein